MHFVPLLLIIKILHHWCQILLLMFGSLPKVDVEICTTPLKVHIMFSDFVLDLLWNLSISKGSQLIATSSKNDVASWLQDNQHGMIPEMVLQWFEGAHGVSNGYIKIYTHCISLLANNVLPFQNGKFTRSVLLLFRQCCISHRMNPASFPKQLWTGSMTIPPPRNRCLSSLPIHNFTHCPLLIPYLSCSRSFSLTGLPASPESLDVTWKAPVVSWGLV